MTTPESNLEQRHLEEMVAYLDGELSSVENSRVEERLSADESYRQQLQGFDRAWSALDELPGMTASDNFSKTTMEMVVSAAQQDVREQTIALPVQRRKRGFAGGLLVATALLVGFLGLRVLRGDPNAMLLADLPAIQYIDVYSQFQSVDFLRKLRQTLGGDLWSAGEESAELVAQIEQFRLVSTEKNRRPWLDGLTADEKLSLRAKYNRFLDLSPSQQEHLREVHQEIISAEDADQLQRTMLLYGQWLGGQPPSRQFELREMPLGERVRTVAHDVQNDRKKPSLELSDQQIDALARKFRRRMPQILAGLDKEQQKHLASLQGRKQAFAFLRLAMQHQSSVGDELRSIINDTLTDEQQQRFDKLSYTGQWFRIMGWLRAATSHDPSKGRRHEISEQEWEEFFAKDLSAAQREELLALPRDKMQHRLRQLYRGQGNGRWGKGDYLDRPPDRHGPPQGRHRSDRPGPPPRQRPRRSE